MGEIADKREQPKNLGQNEKRQRYRNYHKVNICQLLDFTKRFVIYLHMENKSKHTRPSWDQYFIEVMEAVAKRSTCDRGRSGCVIARNNVILSTGYVGSPTGSPHCDDVGHLMKEMIHEDGSKSKHCMRTTHAEANAIAQAAKNGVSIDGATLYCRMTPCRTCAMLISNCGIKRVIVQHDYHGKSETAEIFKNAGVKFEMLSTAPPSYSDQ